MLPKRLSRRLPIWVGTCLDPIRCRNSVTSRHGTCNPQSHRPNRDDTSQPRGTSPKMPTAPWWPRPNPAMSAHASVGGWTHLRPLSAAESTFNYDLGSRRFPRCGPAAAGLLRRGAHPEDVEVAVNEGSTVGGHLLDPHLTRRSTGVDAELGEAGNATTFVPGRQLNRAIVDMAVEGD